MSKLKTQKCVSKRFKITKKGKVLKRKAGQDHFNARESGKTTRKKRRDVEMSKTLQKNIKELIS
ncbi:50S ribosomal protein L35 [Patescibacteria group bacterium]|nr:50S ribosomal protein L35 [Patescibacteria group bacterium]